MWQLCDDFPMYSMMPGLLSIALYLVACTILVRKLATGPGVDARNIGAPAIAAGAVILHAALLYPAVISPEGLNLGFVHAISLVALTTSLLLSLSALFQPIANLGIVVYPLTAISIAILLAWPATHIVTVESWQLQAHILLSLLAYSILGLAVLQAILLSIQDRSLHNRQPGGFIRLLPPLAVMESLLFQMIATGFVLLTLALLTGFLFLEDIFAQHLVHKTALSLAAWLVFGILLWGRWRFGWRGRTAVRWTLGGFVFLMLAYFGSKFVLELLLAD